MRASWRRRWTAAATQFFGPACTSSREAFLWWKHLKRYFCTLRNARVHLEMGTVTEKLQLTGIKEFANSNTCCPGVEDQWQGRAPSDILTSESKQLNRGTTLMYMNVISCWMHSSFHLWEMWPMPMHNAGLFRLFSKLQASFLSCRVACQLLNLHTHCDIWNRAYFNEVFFFFKSVCNWLR